MGRERLLIADAGPFITLAAIGRVELLRNLATDVVIPRTAFEEVIAGAPRPGAVEVRATWIRVADAAPELTGAFSLLVDRGEAEALALVQQNAGSLLVIDDLRARRLASAMGLRLTGTLGVLHMAKRAGLVQSLQEELDGLRRAGFHISESLASAFLRLSGGSREP